MEYRVILERQPMLDNLVNVFKTPDKAQRAATSLSRLHGWCGVVTHGSFDLVVKASNWYIQAHHRKTDRPRSLAAYRHGR